MAVPMRNILRHRTYSVLLCLVTVLLLPGLVPGGNAQAQPRLKSVLEKPASEAARPDVSEPQKLQVVGPVDKFDRGVPRTSVKGFFIAARKGDYKGASQYLDLRNLPPEIDRRQGPRLARQFKIVLDRTLWIDLDLLSDDPQGHADDGLPRHRDVLGRIDVETKTYTLLLQRVPRSDGVFIWKISSATVRQIPELYEHVGYGMAGEALSRIVPEIEIFGAMLWQWVGAVLIMVAAFAIILFPTWAAAFALRREASVLRSHAARFVAGPLRFLFWVLLTRAMVELLSPTVAMRAMMRAETLLVIAVIWIVIRLADFFLEYQANRLMKRGRHAAVVLLRPVKNIVRIVLVLVGLLVWLDNVGFRVTAVLAGLGVGGIAIALAAQRTFEDLIGAITLYISQPVRVGDLCRFGTVFGTVEEIGLRSTRIRTFDNTVVTIPNSEFSKLHLENFATRDKIWFHPRISLPYETTREQIGRIINEIEALLHSHPDILAESARIRFTKIGNYALNLDVFAYVNKKDYPEYLKVAEHLNLSIMEIIERAGTRLALPSQAMYAEGGIEVKGLHTRRGNEAGNEGEGKKEQ